MVSLFFLAFEAIVLLFIVMNSSIADIKSSLAFYNGDCEEEG